MGEIDDIKEEFEQLSSVDKHWIVICAGAAVTALVFALLIGSVIGDVVAFVLAFGAGWIMCTQWKTITGRSRRANAVSGGSPTPLSHSRAARNSAAAE